jgi:hypothetical protein
MTDGNYHIGNSLGRDDGPLCQNMYSFIVQRIADVVDQGPSCPTLAKRFFVDTRIMLGVTRATS